MYGVGYSGRTATNVLHALHLRGVISQEDCDTMRRLFKLASRPAHGVDVGHDRTAELLAKVRECVGG